MHRCKHRTDITSPSSTRSSTALLSRQKTTATFAGLIVWVALLLLTASPLDLSAKERPKAKPTTTKTAKSAAIVKKVAKGEPKKVAKGEPKSVAKSEPKKVAKSVAKSEPKRVAKGEPKKVAKSEPKSVAQVEPKRVAKSEPKIVAKTGTALVREPSTVVASERPAKALPKPYNPLDGVVFPDSTMIEELADGISHHRIRTADNQVANVIIIDIKRGGRIGSYKALDLHDGLENAADIARRAMSNLRDTVLATTNASFWRAGSNTPIGATVSNGEVLELPGYKLWSSLMIFDDGTAEIDRISLRGNFRWSRGALSIDGVNRRGKDDGVVVYNSYYGDSLPHGSYKSDSAIVAEALANRVSAETGDETEDAIDTAALIRDYREEKLRQDREHPLRKIVCTFPKPRRKRAPWPTPKVGEPMTLVVTACDTGVVEVPEHGLVISIGPSVTVGTLPRIGDTVTLAYTVTPRQDKKVVDLLTGTPRLVRNGHAGPEYDVEGSKARRFIRSELARTAVGISRGGDTLFLVTIDSPNRSEDRRGMTLSQLADLMRDIGAYDAMNFDGGGSASMSVNGSMISRQGSGLSRRRVSNALVVMKRALPAKPARSLIDQDTTSN